MTENKSLMMVCILILKLLAKHFINLTSSTSYNQKVICLLALTHDCQFKSTIQFMIKLKILKSSTMYQVRYYVLVLCMVILFSLNTSVEGKSTSINDTIKKTFEKTYKYN